MDFIKFSPATNFRLNRFWIRIKLHFKKMYELVYSREFDLKVCSGHLWGDDHVTIFRLLSDVIYQQAENR